MRRGILLGRPLFLMNLSGKYSRRLANGRRIALPRFRVLASIRSVFTCDTRFRLAWPAKRLTFICGSIRRVFPGTLRSLWTETGVGPAAVTWLAVPGIGLAV